MKEVIVIGKNNNFSHTVNKWLFASIGMALICASSVIIFHEDAQRGSFLLAIFNCLIGLYYLIYSLFGLSSTSKLSPKVGISEELIELKSSFFKAPKFIPLADVSSIRFQPFQIAFKGDNLNYIFNYKSNPEVSKEIKKLVRTAAEKRMIEVLGG